MPALKLLILDANEVIYLHETGISSGDAIVFRVLGLLNRSDQGISLEEVLQKIGHGRTVSRQYTKQFRDRYTKDGEQDSIRGRGTKEVDAKASVLSE